MQQTPQLIQALFFKLRCFYFSKMDIVVGEKNVKRIKTKLTANYFCHSHSSPRNPRCRCTSTFASVCKVTKKTMKCFWTARAEIFLGISIAVFAALQIVFALKNLNIQANIAFSLAIIVNAISVILVPSALIGVCAKPIMHCHSVTEPFLIVAAILIILAVALQTALALLQRSKKTGD